jgi:hypothetical protein
MEKTTKTLTTLPEKWAIEITEENREVLKAWVESQDDFDLEEEKTTKQTAIASITPFNYNQA